MNLDLQARVELDSCLSARDLEDTVNHRLRRVARWSIGAPDSGNLLIHGDNLATLRALAGPYAGKIRCAYLDPPYNNGDSYLHYFDNMGHDEWLASVCARLRMIKALLRPDGSVWISIDDSELHYLKVAADSIFGRENFVDTIVWERRTTRENRKAFSRNHEYLLVYAKDASIWGKLRNSMPLSDAALLRYKNPDSDARGLWQSVSANVQGGHGTASQFYGLKTPAGETFWPPKGRCWVYTEKRMREEIRKGNVWFGRDGKSVPRLKHFLKDRKVGLTPETLWRATEVGTTTSAKKHLIDLFHEVPLFDTPKPEELIHRILQISTNPGDLVLDPYLGSGTTAAVAHKTGRRYIGIEKGEHITSHCVRRLRAVVSGESGGASQAVDWQGGGGFDFFRLLQGKQDSRCTT